MRSIRDLLTRLEDFGRSHTPAEQIKELLGTLGRTGSKDYYGDIYSLIDFVDWLKRTLQAKNKLAMNRLGELTDERTQERIQALGMIHTELLSFSPVSSFPQINRVEFFFQLAVRICEPKLMYQAKSAVVCGPVAVITQMAKKEPLRYEELARKLYRYGRVMIGGVEVVADRELRQDSSTSELGECDYVVLMSLHRSVMMLGPRPWGLRGVSMREIYDWLRRAGYAEVEVHSFSSDESGEWDRYYGRAATGEKVLTEMAQKVASGYTVLMSEDAKIMKSLFREAAIETSPGPGHYAYVSKFKLNKEETHVDEIKVYGWGWSFYKHWTKPYKDDECSVKIFLEHYSGFISFRLG